MNTNDGTLGEKQETTKFLHVPISGVQQNTILHCRRHVGGGAVSMQQQTYIHHLFFSFSNQLREGRMLEMLLRFAI